MHNQRRLTRLCLAVTATISLSLAGLPASSAEPVGTPDPTFGLTDTGGPDDNTAYPVGTPAVSWNVMNTFVNADHGGFNMVFDGAQLDYLNDTYRHAVWAFSGKEVKDGKTTLYYRGTATALQMCTISDEINGKRIRKNCLLDFTLKDPVISWDNTTGEGTVTYIFHGVTRFNPTWYGPERFVFGTFNMLENKVVDTPATTRTTNGVTTISHLGLAPIETTKKLTAGHPREGLGEKLSPLEFSFPEDDAVLLPSTVDESLSAVTIGDYPGPANELWTVAYNKGTTVQAKPGITARASLRGSNPGYRKGRFVSMPQLSHVDVTGDIPEGMSVDFGSGRISYKAPESALGTTVEIPVTIHWLDTTTSQTTATFRVSATGQAPGSDPTPDPGPATSPTSTPTTETPQPTTGTTPDATTTDSTSRPQTPAHNDNTADEPVAGKTTTAVLTTVIAFIAAMGLGILGSLVAVFAAGGVPGADPAPFFRHR